MYTTSTDGNTWRVFDNGKVIETFDNEPAYLTFLNANLDKFQNPEPEETEAELMAQMETIWAKLKAKRK